MFIEREELAVAENVKTVLDNLVVRWTTVSAVANIMGCLSRGGQDEGLKKKKEFPERKGGSIEW
jgi:hypothetical protein